MTWRSCGWEETWGWQGHLEGVIWLEPSKEAALAWVALKAETGLGASGVFSWGSLEAEVREQEE